jgi:hypothetical protein
MSPPSQKQRCSQCSQCSFTNYTLYVQSQATLCSLKAFIILKKMSFNSKVRNPPRMHPKDPNVPHDTRQKVSIKYPCPCLAHRLRSRPSCWPPWQRPPSQGVLQSTTAWNPPAALPTITTPLSSPTPWDSPRPPPWTPQPLSLACALLPVRQALPTANRCRRCSSASPMTSSPLEVLLQLRIPVPWCLSAL